MFSNRLRKNARHWGKWARRQGISCYRIYDRDIPELPLAIDIYGERVHLQEYDSSQQQSEAEHAPWLEELRRATAEALEVRHEAVACKLRARQKGLSQYEKTGASGKDFTVNEGGCRFIVNLDSYLDTGLFLDHRNTRRLIAERARGKHFLNLFAYTGSFSVYAAAGGANRTTSVDLSNTYLDWAQRNFALNAMDPAQHRLVRADVFKFLAQAVQERRIYGLIMLDPPSFSNSKKMSGVLDVQRDQALLLNQCLQLLTPTGELFFSTNLRSFKLEDENLAPCQIEEISKLTVPEDFRNKKIHRCWRITKKEGG
jgi:23S rRNA (cytosine1962-C5)-methyltransferase